MNEKNLYFKIIRVTITVTKSVSSVIAGNPQNLVFKLRIRLYFESTKSYDTKNRNKFINHIPNIR